MYLPKDFTVEDRGVVLDILRQVGFGHLVTAAGKDGPGPAATALPFIVEDDLGGLLAHFSRANAHWRSIDGTAALMIVPTHDAYVTPSWYPSKADHGKVVPTWNYELIHLHGTVEIHDEPEWTGGVVRAMTEHNERRLTAIDPARSAWSVDDAPPDFIEQQIRAIVGVRLDIERIEAKRKLSQNRAEPDRLGAIDGLAASPRDGDRAVAELMRSTADPTPGV